MVYQIKFHPTGVGEAMGDYSCGPSGHPLGGWDSLGDHSFWKECPPRPPKKAQGRGRFDSPSPLDPSPPTTKGGELRFPSPWISPQALLLQKASQRPALCGGALAPAPALLRSGVRGLFLFLALFLQVQKGQTGGLNDKGGESAIMSLNGRFHLVNDIVGEADTF